MNLIRYFRGFHRVKLTGACVEGYLNLLAQERIVFWNIERYDELHYGISLYKKDLAQAQTLALRCYCDFQIMSQSAFSQLLRTLVKRPVLVLGMLAAVLITFWMQTTVLAIRIDGNETLHKEEILRALEQLDIHIGASADVDQQLTKHRMLNLLPQLSWIGVNRNGFQLNVLLTERSLVSSDRPKYSAGNIISVRDAVITDYTVSEGMRICKVGDTVKKGQILVSGFEDYGLIIKAVCAEAEIYGQTWYDSMVVMPQMQQQKTYTGAQKTEYSLIIGRKRINLSRNSGILDTTCDKMVSVIELSLPNYKFPIRLEKVTWRAYVDSSVQTDADFAQERLQRAWQELTLSQTIAGRMLHSENSFYRSGELYVLRSKSVCREMIARLVPIEPIFEGETNE